MDIEELHKIECHALPGSGACGMSTVFIFKLKKYEIFLRRVLWHYIIICFHTENTLGFSCFYIHKPGTVGCCKL